MPTSGAPVGVVGLGSMGSGVFELLVERGWNVRGCDRAAAVRAAFAERGHSVEPDFAAWCRDVDAIVLSLPSRGAVASVVCGDATRPGLAMCVKRGCLVIDCSTTTPGMARRAAAALRERGADYLDAPVSGGAASARSGTLTMMLAGSEAVRTRGSALIGDMTKRVIFFDEVGEAQVAKLLNNLLVAVHLRALGEASAIAQRWGVEEESLLSAVNASSGRSAVSEVNFPRWILNDAFDSGFSMKLMRKDVEAAMDLAREGVYGDHEDGEGLDAERFPLLAKTGELWCDSLTRLDDEADFNRMGRLGGSSR